MCRRSLATVIGCGRQRETCAPASPLREEPVLANPALQPSTVRNHLLATLPPSVLAQLVPRMRSAPLAIHATLYAPGAKIEAAWFPEAGMTSLVADLADGARAEVGVVGREGMVGLPLAFGVETAYTEAMVQGTGTALRTEAGAFRQALDESPAFRDVLFRYNEALQAQISQTAACNGHHGLEQHLARWLLMAHDRTAGDDLPLTQEFLSLMLCVHRPGVTVAARILQRASLIRYSGGTITVLDRPGLEAASCECYDAITQRYRQLLC